MLYSIDSCNHRTSSFERARSFTMINLAHMVRDQRGAVNSNSNNPKRDEACVSDRFQRLTATVMGERARALDWSDKAVQPEWYGRSSADVTASHPSLDTLSTPMCTLSRRAIDANLQSMAQWCDNAGLS